MLTLRRMDRADLDLVREWLGDSEVARWYLPGSSVEQEVEDLARCVSGQEPTEALVVEDQRSPIGWCQWYQCRDYPEYADGVGSGPDDIGIDYAIGDSTRRGHGNGTAMIAAIVAHVRQRHPLAGIIADPEASNVASRRVLERNGFEFVAVRPVASEATPAPMAIYRLGPPAAASDSPARTGGDVRRASGGDVEAVGRMLHEARPVRIRSTGRSRRGLRAARRGSRKPRPGISARPVEILGPTPQRRRAERGSVAIGRAKTLTRATAARSQPSVLVKLDADGRHIFAGH